MVIRQLLEIRVDESVYDLAPYLDAAAADGWERNNENAVWYLALEMIDSVGGYGFDGEPIS